MSPWSSCASASDGKHVPLTASGASMPLEGCDTLNMPSEMDGLLHNFARHKRRQSSTPAALLPGFESSPSSQKEHATPDLSPKAATTSPTSLKSILKSPRVRFPDELEESRGAHHDRDAEPASSNRPMPLCERCAMSKEPPPPPPSPPPPPPVQPISLFLPTIEKDKHLSEVAYRLYTRFIDELADFVEIQKNVVMTRLIVLQKRQELKRMREEVSRCDMALMDRLRRSVAEGSNLDYSEIAPLFEASQAARDKAGPCEVEYEPLEVQLGAEEDRLGHTFGLIEARFEAFFNLIAKTTTQQSEQPIEYEESSAASGGDKEWTGPEGQEALLYGTLIGGQIGVGQPPILAGELPVSHPAEGVWGMKKPTDPSEVGLEPSEKRLNNLTTGEGAQVEDEPFLSGFSENENPTNARLLQNSRENRILSSLEGVGSNTLFESIKYPEEEPRSSDLQDADDLLLLGDDSESQSVLSDYLTNFENARDRVNRWLLHQLRLSPRAIHALRRNVVECLPGNADWARSVLQQWSNDDLGQKMLYHTNSAVRDKVEPVHHRRISRPYPDAEPPASTFSARRKLRSESRSRAARAATSENFSNVLGASAGI
ncbi:hypothetical protein BDW02DRAFT_649109 [Decorospora gaudefroyi]|uniref:Uncharacterized protein n=1 Tax=Decorospora gaudefroyi TaxID=184978 RepID=A0A6A5KDD6_9PLEO|nr:hypothetical protein BDW02DRAFT_649109 [Decorospora gaudefroyi]